MFDLQKPSTTIYYNCTNTRTESLLIGELAPLSADNISPEEFTEHSVITACDPLNTLLIIEFSVKWAPEFHRSIAKVLEDTRLSILFIVSPKEAKEALSYPLHRPVSFLPSTYLTTAALKHFYHRATDRQFTHALLIQAQERADQLKRKLSIAKEEVKRLRYFDPVLEIPNRAAIIAILSRDLARVRRDVDTNGLTVTLVHIDGLGTINDQLGLESGDQYLKNIAETLSRNMREYDYIGRYSSNELLVIASFSHRGGATLFWQRVLTVLQGERIHLVDEHLPVKVHLGLTTSATASVDAILSTCDDAVKQAKEEQHAMVYI